MALGKEDAVKMLMDYGADVNKVLHNGSTPLHTAAYHNFHSSVDILAKHHAKINAVNHSYQTPLIVACASPMGHTKTIELLIELRADVNARDKRGETALHKLAYNDLPELVKLLVKNGASSNVRNEKEKTPLDIAIDYKQDEVVDVLAPITLEE